MTRQIVDSKIQVYPQGFCVGQNGLRPALLFKDKSEDETLPIWFEPAVATAVLGSTQEIPPAAAGKAALKILKGFGVEILSVDFNELSGPVQYATVNARQNDKLEINVKVPAGDAVLLAMHVKRCSYFSNKETMEKAKHLYFEWVLNTWASDSRANQSQEGIH